MVLCQADRSKEWKKEKGAERNREKDVHGDVLCSIDSIASPNALPLRVVLLYRRALASCPSSSLAKALIPLAGSGNKSSSYISRDCVGNIAGVLLKKEQTLYELDNIPFRVAKENDPTTGDVLTDIFDRIGFNAVRPQ